MKERQEFQYWQRPGVRWLFLGAGVLQLANLAMQISDWRQLAEAEILSPDNWQVYCAQQGLSCSIAGLLAVVFLGCFAIGQRAKSRPAARWAEGVMLLGLAVTWAAVGIGLQAAFAVPRGQSLFWLALLAALAVGGGASLWQSGRAARMEENPNTQNGLTE